MRRDLIIGVLVSILLHGGVVGLGQLFGTNTKKSAAKDETPTILISQPPPLEPDEPETVDLTEPQATPETASLAPPSIVDIPGVVLPDSFTQQIQPPPPPNMGKASVMAIPPGRPGTGNIGKGLGEVFDIRNLDQQPQVRGVQSKPNYPFEMKRAGITGDVLVQFIVDSNGDTRDAVVLKSSQREFEAPAIQAVLRWKFKPGRKGGKAVATRMQIPIVFSLSDE